MKRVRYFGAGLAFVLSLYLIVKGQRLTDKWGLLMMLAGVCGLLLNLYFYNRRHAS